MSPAFLCVSAALRNGEAPPTQNVPEGGPRVCYNTAPRMPIVHTLGYYNEFSSPLGGGEAANHPEGTLTVKHSSLVCADSWYEPDFPN